jgi:hypothetical protein
MDNANPTVLNATDLPTRRGRDGTSKKKVAGSEIQELLEMKSRYIIQDSDLSDPESELESDEDVTVEPIDEQEIYGMLLLALPFWAESNTTNRFNLYYFRSGASALSWVTGRSQPS